MARALQVPDFHSTAENRAAPATTHRALIEHKPSAFARRDFAKIVQTIKRGEHKQEGRHRG